MIRLLLTAEQIRQIAPHQRPGVALLGRVLPEPFDGSNAATSGRLVLELGCVKESALPALRAAIQKAGKKKTKKKKESKG